MLDCPFNTISIWGFKTGAAHRSREPTLLGRCDIPGNAKRPGRPGRLCKSDSSPVGLPFSQSSTSLSLPKQWWLPVLSSLTPTKLVCESFVYLATRFLRECQWNNCFPLGTSLCSFLVHHGEALGNSAYLCDIHTRMYQKSNWTKLSRENSQRRALWMR